MKYFCEAKIFWLGLGLNFQATKRSLGGAGACPRQGQRTEFGQVRSGCKVNIKIKILWNDVKTLFQIEFGFRKIFNFVPKITSKTYKSKPVLLLSSEEDLDLLVVPKYWFTLFHFALGDPVRLKLNHIFVILK